MASGLCRQKSPKFIGWVEKNWTKLLLTILIVWQLLFAFCLTHQMVCYDPQQSFDHCCTSVNTFAVVRALLDRIRRLCKTPRQGLRPHSLCVPHEDVQKLYSIVSLWSYFEIHTITNLFFDITVPEHWVS